MKPILNPKIERYIALEYGTILHQLSYKIDEQKLYVTKCDLPIAFEENYKTVNKNYEHRPEYTFGYYLYKVCDICGKL